MKRVLIFLSVLLCTSFFSFSQDRFVTRGATPGEFYINNIWYWKNPPFMDTLYKAVYRCTEHGKKITIQYSVEDFSASNSEMRPDYILADATPGVLYNKQTAYVNGSYVTQLYASFDYGKNWVLRDQNSGADDDNFYYGTNAEGVIYRAGRAGVFKSINYGEDFILMENIGAGQEPGLNDCEFFGVGSYNFYYTSDCWQNYMTTPIGAEYFSTIDYDIYRGGLPGEVYVSSVFTAPGNGNRTYHVSFSADTGHTFHKVYISEVYNVFAVQGYPYFMSDREPGVFYIIKLYYVKETTKWDLEQHLKLCIEYYRDYGETLEAVFCHDITKDYEYQEVICEHTTSLNAEVNHNSVQLTWSNAAENIRGYHVYRDNVRITQQLFTESVYLDENLPNGNYEYYVRTYYNEGCVSDSSNHVTETVALGAEELTMNNEQLTIYPNPTTGELSVIMNNEQLIMNNVEVFDVYGRNVGANLRVRPQHTVLDISGLQAGIYLVKVTTEKGFVMKKIVKL